MLYFWFGAQLLYTNDTNDKKLLAPMQQYLNRRSTFWYEQYCDMARDHMLIPMKYTDTVNYCDEISSLNDFCHFRFKYTFNTNIKLAIPEIALEWYINQRKNE